MGVHWLNRYRLLPRKLVDSADRTGSAGEVPAEGAGDAGGGEWWTAVDGCGNDDGGGDS